MDASDIRHVPWCIYYVLPPPLPTVSSCVASFFFFCYILKFSEHPSCGRVSLYTHPCFSVGHSPVSRLPKSEVMCTFKLETYTGGNFMGSSRISKYSSTWDYKEDLPLWQIIWRWRMWERTFRRWLLLNNTGFPWKGISQDCSILLFNFPFKGILFYLKYFISRNYLKSLF